MKVMTNLWGFEKQVTLSRMSGGRFGLMQTTGQQNVNAVVRVFNRATGGSELRTVNVPVTLDRYDSGTGDLQHTALTQHDIATIIDHLRANGQINPNERIEVAISQADDDTNGPHVARSVTSNRIQVTRAMLNDADQRLRNTSTQASSTTAAPATPPPPPNPPAQNGAQTGNGQGAAAQGANGNGSAAPANTTNHDIELAHAQSQDRMAEAAQQHQFAAQDASRQTQSAAALAAASRPNEVSQVIGSIMNPIAGTFASLGTAAAMASWGGNCYSGFGPLGGCGTNPLLPMTVASTFMNGGFGCGGGFNAIGGAGGGMGGGFGGLDLIGMGNTFYGQALDERSRARALDVEINRLKAMIMMGNFDAILQAVTLLTLRSKGMVRQASLAMINSVQNSNRQMEEQNRRLEALASSSGANSSNSSNSSSNQYQMMMINNNIQGINMDRQTAMNALKDMSSNLEESTSSEANIRRSFEQIRQIQNRA